MSKGKTLKGKSARLADPALDDSTFEHLRERITGASGIHIDKDDNARFLLERRLLPRLRVRGLTSFTDYKSAIDEEEMELMLDLVAVHETYFFREKKQLDTFSQQILPELSSAADQIKIWSAGCSTGEEAYTIAMLLAEHDLLEDGRIELIASDLSRRVIESGIKGVYGQSSFRATDASYREKYFSEAGRDRWQASERLRSSICFEQSNLIRLDQSVGAHSPDEFDVIFCRNVLMYFDEEAVNKTLNGLHSLLKKGGYLLLGHAESLLPLGTGFDTIQLGREIVHRK